MNRIHHAQAEAISQALAYIPPRLHGHLGCDLFCSDPIFAGLHRADRTDDGRSRRNIAHVCFPSHVADRRITFVWPDQDNRDPVDMIYTAVHELGHVLHAHLGQRAGWKQLPCLQNVTEYAKTNYAECFAEAFTAWTMARPQTMDQHPYWPWGYSRHNAEWFDRLLRA